MSAGAFLGSRDPDAEIAALREEIRNLTIGYAASEQRAAAAEESAKEAERCEQAALKEAAADREFAQGKRAEAFAKERVAEYRERAQTAERELADIKRSAWRHSTNNHGSLVQNALKSWGLGGGDYLPTGALIDICKAVHGLTPQED